MRPSILPGGQWVRRSRSRLGRSRLAVYGATATLAAGLAGYGLSGAAAGTGTHGAAPPPPVMAGGAVSYNAATGSTQRAATPATSAQTDVTLITGDQARLSTAPDGQQIVSPLPSAGPAATHGSSGFVQFTSAGQHYLVPDEAAAYLSAGTLDPRLFDVSYLATAKFGGAVPVRVGYTSRAVPSLPGLRVRKAATGTATGTLTSAAALRFGRLLASDRAAGGRLPGITRISLAPPSSAPPLPAAPAVPAASGAGQQGASPAGAGPGYHTLTLKFVAPDGTKGTALGLLQNVGDSNLMPGDEQALSLGEGGIIFAEANGVYRLSVPDGTYSAEFSIITPDAGTFRGYDAALATNPQFTVDKDTTITLNAAATVPYHVTLSGITAPPVQTDQLNLVRGSAAGPAANTSGLGSVLMDLISVSGDGYTGSQLSATPTATVTTGTFGFEPSAWLGDTPLGGAEPDSTYALEFPSNGAIPSSLDYTVFRQDLTAYHQNLYDNPLGSCGNADTPAVFVFQPAVGAVTTWQYQATGGGARTDYWYDANPRLDLWQPAILPADCNTVGGWSIALDDAPRTIHPGQAVTETWNKAPLTAPSAAAPTFAGVFGGSGNVGSPSSTLCSACRQGDGAFVSIVPFGDSDPAHYSDPGDSLVAQQPTAAEFFQNGKKVIVPGCSYHLGGGVAGCSLALTDLELPLLHQPARYQLDWSYQDWTYDTATTTTVDWGFRSAPDPSAGRLPAQELCPPVTSQGCSYLPLLYIGYNLALNYAGQAQAGQSFPVTFTVAHQQGETPPAGVSATVSASFDNGQTWTTPQAAASLGGNRFAAAIQQPPLAQTSGFVSLRVTARDSAGDSVTETLIKAYGLTG
jgi:hypothetical protein